ncbi:MAG: glycerol-3-phosphate 1-O-acyltransferase PlsY [Alistipes sp.]|nr:glycerol-3-phosphate 1-O-acyltransferase PlsY [Alistipes sp.]
MVVTYCAVIMLLIVAYLLGSIPSAVWIGKHYYGVDIREHGSRNAGATNMLRVLGLRAALPVFVIDFFKGFLAVSLMGLMRFDVDITTPWVINLKIIAVAFAVLGHIFPVFASFKGGKGVSTLIGAITGIQPNIALLCFLVWLLVFVFTHYVSLSSIISGCSFPVFVTVFSGNIYRLHGDTSISFILFSFVVAFLLVWTHRANISRLRSGTEPKTYIWKKRR